MKKLLLQIAFLLLIIPAFSQGFVTVNGTVTDLATGNPIPNHAVTILSDSTSGFFYYNVEYTNAQGFYIDTVFTGVAGTLFIQTFDCNNVLHQDIWNYTPIQTHTSTFAICNSTAAGCQAAFTAVNDSINSILYHFIDQSSGNIISWSWNFGDPASGVSNISTIQNPTHIYSQAGTYNTCLTVQGADSTCFDMTCETLVVGTGGVCHAQFTYYADTSNTGNIIQFIDQSTAGTGSIVSWKWDFGDGSPVQVIVYPANPNVTHTYLLPGTYTACLTIHGSDSTCYDQTCQSISVGSNTGCQANFNYSIPTWTSFPTLFMDLSQASGGGQITSWSWDFGDPASGANNLSFIQNPSHLFNIAGSYNVCLTIHGTDSTCFDMICKTIIVDSNSYCQAYFAYSTDTVLGNNTIAFTDLSTGNPTSWMWIFENGYTSNVQNPVHTFAAPGTYNVCLTITGNNCTSTYCQNVVIQDTTNYHQIYGQVFEGNFPMNMGMAMIFSFDTVANYQPYVAVFPIDSNGVYYFTTVPDGNYYILALPFDSNGFLPTYYGNVVNWQQATLINLGTPDNPYNINLVPSDQMTGGPGSASGHINMGDLNSAMLDKINMILMNDQGKPIGFTKVSTAGAFSFPTMAYGTYYLHPEMPGVISDNVMIVITAQKPHAEVIMTFTGNKILSIGNEQTMFDRWSVYPNPVIDKLTVSVDMKQSTRTLVEIYNMAGQLISHTSVILNDGVNKIEISTSSLPSGIYSLRIYSKEGMNINTKLVVTK